MLCARSVSRPLFAVLMLLVLVAAVPGSAGATGDRTYGLRCGGLRATIVGTDDADKIVGTDKNDVIVGGRGDDTIDGKGGDDVICGNDGRDVINAGPGHDFVRGGRGADVVFGGDGKDRMLGGRGADQLNGEGGNDRIFGGRGKDRLNGGPDHDYLSGGRGTDTCTEGESYRSCETIDSPTGSCFGQDATITGTDGDDELTGTEADDVIVGAGGDDIISGGGGNDLICGGEGEDEILGGIGADQLDGGPDDDVISGEEDDDTVIGGDGNDTLFGADGNDDVDGGAGQDEVFGGAGEDSVSGGADDDAVSGGQDSDTNDGGPGIDVCVDDVEGNTFVDCEESEAPVEVPQTGLPLSWEPLPYIEDVEVAFSEGSTATPQDVVVALETDRTYSAASSQASLSWNFFVPPELEFGTADLTIRYLPEAAPGFDESQMRIYRFDDDLGLWTSIPGDQTVDVENDTVTATVDGFSVYAVFALGPNGFADAFGPISVTCLSTGSDVGLDVSLIIDTSGSMLDNDPAGLRVDGAQAFVDAMRERDRAGVISFSTTAITQIGLTPLDSPANISAVMAAVDQTSGAFGGTNLSAAMSSGISMLSGGASGQARVAILLTDGVSPYDTALTSQAAAANIVVYTIGLGAGVDAALLQGIASGTGGRYEQLNSASQLVSLYEELSGDLIDDGTDSDGDGLTDCQETNGVITTQYDNESGFTTRLVTSNPNTANSDTDELEDGEEFRRVAIDDNPALREEYGFLLDAGVEFVYILNGHPTRPDADFDGLLDHEEVRGVVGVDGETYRPDPNDRDTDDDLVNDGIEVQVLGSDPLDPRDPNADDPSIVALDPPGTFVPAGIGSFIDIDRFGVEFQYNLDGVTYTNTVAIDGRIIFYGSDPVRCERAECGELWQAAEDRIDSWEAACNFFGGGGGIFDPFFPGGDCDDVEGLVQDLTKDYIAKQRLFTENGQFRGRYAAEVVANACYGVAAIPDECENNIINDAVDDEMTVPEIEDAIVEVLTNLPGGRRPISDDGFEETQLRKRGLARNTTLRRPTITERASQLFQDIVGPPKFTPAGQPRGTILDSVGGNQYWEMKGGSSQLSAGYQLRLQIFYAAQDGKPYRLVTDRPLSEPLQRLVNQYGSVSKPLC